MTEPLTPEERDALDAALTVVIAAARALDLSQAMPGRVDGFLAALASVYPPLAVVPLDAARAQPSPDLVTLTLNEHGRVECVCGRSVLPENWPNHLKAVSYGREHHAVTRPDPDPLDVTHLAAPGATQSRATGASGTCDHPGDHGRSGTVLGLLAAALSGAIVGGLVVLALTLLAAPRPAQATLPSPAVDVSGGPAVSPELTGALRVFEDRGAPSLQVGGAAAGAASSDSQRLASLASRP